MYILSGNEPAVNVRQCEDSVRTHVSSFCATLRGGQQMRTKPRWWLSLGCIRGADTPDLGRWLPPDFAGAQVAPCGPGGQLVCAQHGRAVCSLAALCVASTVWCTECIKAGLAMRIHAVLTIDAFKNWNDVTLKIVFGRTGERCLRTGCFVYRSSVLLVSMRLLSV